MVLTSIALPSSSARLYWCKKNEECEETHFTAFIEINNNTMYINYALDKGRYGLVMPSETFDIATVSNNEIVVTDSTIRIMFSSETMTIDYGDEDVFQYRFLSIGDDWVSRILFLKNCH